MLHLNKLYWVLISVFVILYIYYIDILAIDMPIGDDYDLVRVKYILSTQNLSWVQRLNVLIAPANDHRILVPRLMALIDYSIEGFINYRTIIWISNLSILGIIAFWKVSLQKSGLTLWHLMPLIFWYLNPFLYDLNLWGMNGVQHTTLNLLVFASLYLLATYSQLLPAVFALVLAFAATFTNGNGFLVFPAGLSILLLEKKWTRSVWWSIGMIVALLAYFLNYSIGQATKVTFSGQFFQNLIVSFAALSGGWIAVFKGYSQAWLLWSAFFVGLIILIGLTFWVISQTVFPSSKPRQSQTLFWTGVFLFSVMTIGIIALSRGAGDVYSIFTSRYSLYPLHLLTLAYISLVTWKAVYQKWIARFAFVFGIAFVVMSFYQYQLNIDIRRRSLVADHYNWRQHRKLITNFRSELANFFTQPAYDKGIYRFTHFPLRGAEVLISAPADTVQLQETALKLSNNIKSIDFFNHPQKIAQFTLENTGLVQPDFGKAGAFLVLKSPKNTTYLLPTWPIQGGKRQFLTSGKVYTTGFKATFYNENFVPDTYRIGILSPSGNGYSLHYVSHSIKIDSLHTQLIN